MLIRAAEMLDQVTSEYMNLWNEVAISVGAEEVFYIAEPSASFR